MGGANFCPICGEIVGGWDEELTPCKCMVQQSAQPTAEQMLDALVEQDCMPKVEYMAGVWFCGVWRESRDGKEPEIDVGEDGESLQAAVAAAYKAVMGDE